MMNRILGGMNIGVVQKLGAVAAGAIIAGTAWLGIGGSIGASALVPDPVTCLPTCEVDGRSLVSAGDDPTTLAAQAITIGLNFTEAAGPTGNFELFDGDRVATNWDVLLNCGAGCPDNGSAAPELIVELYADPAGIGGSGLPLLTWTPGAAPSGTEQGPFPVTNNAWNGVTFNHDPAALNGTNYQYSIQIRPAAPSTDKGWNAFKVRAAGTVLLLGNQVVGFIGAMNNPGDLNTIYPNFPTLTPTVYDGTWVFRARLPAFLGDVTIFDGDMDFGNAACEYNDTDDADSAGVPPFALGSAAVDEGVAVANVPSACTGGVGTRTGTPAEDNTSAGFRRVPTIIPAGIAYRLVAPDGQIFLNANPSGNKEWEQFKVQLVAPGDVTSGACPVGGYPADVVKNYAASDCRTTSLPGGVWEVQLDGMDLSNLNFWFFSFKVEPIVTEYSIGRLVWYDANENGVQDLCAGVPCAPELGIAGVAYTVYDGPLPANVIRTGVTDANGEFLEEGLQAANHTVVIDAANFLAAAPLNGLTSTTGGETQNGIEVGLPECVDTNNPVGCGEPMYAEALFGYVRKADVCVGEPETISLKSASSSATDGSDGNSRLFGGTIRATAWARNRSTGAWSTAWLGQFGTSGLGVTDNTEGNGDNNRHIVDNGGGMDNYMLFEFAAPKVLDKVDLTYIQGDSDITVWIGTKADAFTATQTLSDAYLTSLGFTEINDGGVSSGSRTADVNDGAVSGNIVIVAAQTGSETNDGFKMPKLVLGCPAPPAPSISIVKKTNGTNNDTGTGPNVTVGSTVTWTYIVTNTGNVTLTNVAVTDDKVGAICTIGTLAAGASSTCSKTGTAIAGQYVNIGTVTGTPPEGPPVTATNPDRYYGISTPCVAGSVSFTTSSSSASDGTNGNTRLFYNNTIRASAWARNRSTGAWSQAWLGRYASGLGVTDSSEGDGGSNRHLVDNGGGMDNYVLFEFQTPMVVDKVGLAYIQGDSDISVWIGTKANAFTASQTLSDAYLTSLGFTQISDSSVTSGSRTAELNGSNVSGNILIVSAKTGTNTNDAFKMSKLILTCPSR
jgi:hypothetical protein